MYEGQGSLNTTANTVHIKKNVGDIHIHFVNTYPKQGIYNLGVVSAMLYKKNLDDPSSTALHTVLILNLIQYNVGWTEPTRLTS